MAINWIESGFYQLPEFHLQLTQMEFMAFQSWHQAKLLPQGLTLTVYSARDIHLLDVYDFLLPCVLLTFNLDDCII